MNDLTTHEEEKHLSVRDIKLKVNIIQQVMKDVMIKDVHYGPIPGCGKKHTLLKAGAEKILMTFQIAVCPPEVEDLSSEDCIRYRVITKGVSMKTGNLLGSGIGECSSDEEKYKWKKAVCQEEFDETDADRKREKWGKDWKTGKAYKTKQIRTNPADVANTILKMGKKRSMVDLTLTTTAASDCFEQDLDETDNEENEPNLKQPKRKPTVKTDVVSVAQIARMFAIAEKKNVSEAHVRQIIGNDPYKYASSKDIKKEHYDKIIEEIEKRGTSGGKEKTEDQFND